MSPGGHRQDPPTPPPTGPGPSRQRRESAPPADPWPDSPYPSFAPVTVPAAGTARRVPRWLTVVAAATAVVAVATFVVVLLWPGSADPDDPLAFRSVERAGEVSFGEGATPMFTAIVGGSTYLAAELPTGDGVPLEVARAELAAGAVMWRTTVVGADDWSYLVARKDVVVAVAAAIGSSTPRPMVVLDAETGAERWRYDVHGEDAVYVRTGVIGVVDREGAALRVLDLDDGAELRSIPFPEDEYGWTTVSVLPVYSEDDQAGPAGLSGRPELRGDDRVVMIGADRSARVIDLRDGTVLRERANVADPDDVMMAYADRLYVANDDPGYRVVSYDLADLSERSVYTSDDTQRRPVAMRHCYQDRLCLLDRTVGGDTARVVVVRADGGGAVWDRAAPQVDRLLPVGRWLLVGGDLTPVVFYDAEGTAAHQRDGFPVRINAGNLLLFNTTPGGYTQDLSLAGFPVGGSRVELGLLSGVRGAGCSWAGVHLVCPTQDIAVIWTVAD